MSTISIQENKISYQAPARYIAHAIKVIISKDKEERFV